MTTAPRNEDLLALQSYVTAQDAVQFNHLHSNTIALDLTHENLVQRHIEIRFDRHETIDDLRHRIYRQTGTPPSSQVLQLKGLGGRMIAVIHPHDGQDVGSRMLGYYGLESGDSVHCLDVDPNSGSARGGYENVNLVKKYVMSDDEYDKRKGTLREWGRKQKDQDETFTLERHARDHRELMEARRRAKLGLELPTDFEYGPDGEVVRVADTKNGVSGNSNNNEATKTTDEDVFGIDSVKGIEVGMRCEVQPGGRRGTVAFVGEVSELGSGGYWIGVHFDEPVGKTDGTAPKSNKRYFEAPERHGGFVRARNVSVGDYPERDIFDEIDSDSEEDEL